MRISDWSSDMCSSDLPRPSTSSGRGLFVASLILSLSKGEADCAAARLERAAEHALGGRHLVGLARVDGARLPERAGDADRKRVVQGKSVSVRVDLGGRVLLKQKRTHPIN